MSINNDSAVVIGAGVLVGYQKATRAAGLTTTEFEGAVTGLGSSVKVRSVNDVQVQTFTRGGSITTDELVDNAILLTLDQAKAASFLVDDSVEDQAAYVNAAAERAGALMAGEIDLHIATIMHTGAGVDLGAAVDLTAEGAAYNYLVGIKVALKDTTADMNVLVPSEFVGHLLQDSRFITAEEQRNGIVGRAAGLTIIESNVLGNDKVVAVSDPSAVASAVSINKTERFRPADKFADGVKTLAIYGAAVIKPEAVAAGTVAL